ncbi:MAG: PD-(D/E)XK nuclease family protein, partial [Dehalococcoidia bacterium]
MSKPNIFTHATSELSQDAVLAWLLSWADAKSAEHDQELARLGRGFLELLFRRHDVSCPPSPEVVVEAQADRMDVRADVDGRYCILIEDKVGTVQHSDQLRTYINAVLSSGKYDRDNILPIYVQTHEQCVYDKVESARFKPVRRSDLLELFGEYRERGGKSDIALDFLDHLHGLERAFTAFRTTPVHDRWSSKAWTGFMAELRGSLY